MWWLLLQPFDYVILQFGRNVCCFFLFYISPLRLFSRCCAFWRKVSGDTLLSYVRSLALSRFRLRFLYRSRPHTLFGHAELFCILCGSVLFCFVPFTLLPTCLFYFLRSPIQGKRQNIQNSIIDSIHIYTRTLTTHK